MKKLISLLLVICMLCPLFVGCVQKQTVDDELKIEIIEDYLSWSGLKGDLLAADVECTFLGKYGNSVAVYFNSAGAYDVETEETIKGITFTYPDSRVIRIWNNGKFYKISDAYEQELIKKRHIKSIYKESQSIVHGEPLFIWEEKIYCDYDEYRHPVYLTPDFILDAYNLTVTIDANLSRPEKIFDSEFFESIGVTEIRDTTEYYSNNYPTIYPNDAYRNIYFIKLAHPSSKENMKRVVAILEAKEGIKMVRPSQQGYGLSGTTVSDSSDEPINWGLQNIHVDKVWEFTTGNLLYHRK